MAWARPRPSASSACRCPRAPFAWRLSSLRRFSHRSLYHRIHATTSGAGASGGPGQRWRGNSDSTTADSASTPRSSRCRPVICRPIGRPSAVKPIGTDAAGSPVRLASAEKAIHAVGATARPAMRSGPARSMAKAGAAVVGVSRKSWLLHEAPGRVDDALARHRRGGELVAAPAALDEARQPAGQDDAAPRRQLLQPGAVGVERDQRLEHRLGVADRRAGALERARPAPPAGEAPPTRRPPRPRRRPPHGPCRC